MKIENLTITEISFIQYVMECTSYRETPDINQTGIEMASRLSKITSNLIMSKDNQVKV
jgi:hypothetical protein